MRLSICGLDVALSGLTIVSGCELIAHPGEFVGLVGPNGSGKSTLLRAAYRALKPAAGRILLDDDDLWALRPRACAQRVAVLAQHEHLELDFTVHEVVALGRVPHHHPLDRAGHRDEAVVMSSLQRAGAADLAHRVFSTLSGGERQRVLLAKALAQETPVLLLDEPTNHLDVRAQLDLLDLVRGAGLTVLAALHDLNLAAAYCDRIYVMHRGSVARGGTPSEVLTPEVLSEIFGVVAHPMRHPGTGRMVLAFESLPRPHAETPPPNPPNPSERTQL